MPTEIIDGKLSLADQENTLNGVEQALSAKTVKYAGQQDGTQNQATLRDVPIADPLKQLSLQAVNVGGSTVVLIAQYQQKGQALAFQGNGLCFRDSEDCYGIPLKQRHTRSPASVPPGFMVSLFQLG